MVLRFGSRGHAVEELQKNLNRFVGSPVKIPGAVLLATDGAFGKITLKCFRAFQVFAKIKNDGACGPISQSALTKHLARLPKTAQTPDVPPRQKAPAEMTKEQIDDLVRENVEDYHAFVRGMGKYYDPALGWMRRGFNLAKLSQLISALESTVVAGSAGIGSSMALTLTAMIQWSRALESAERTYGYRGAAYAATAWYFDKPVLYKSTEMRKRTLDFKFEPDMVPYDNAWKEATNRTIATLDQKNYGTVSKADVKRAMRLVFRDDQAKFCKEMLEGFSDKVGIHQAAIWKQNYNVVYPM